MRRHVDSRLACHLPQRAFCEAVGETVGFAHGALVGGHDNGASAAGGNDGRQRGLHGVYGAEDIGVDDLAQLFGAYIEYGVGAVDACVGNHAAKASEVGGGFGNGRFDILPAACASPEEDYRQRRKRAGEFTAGIGVDIHECHLPAAGGEQFHAGAPYAFGAPADKYTAFHEVKVTNKSRAKPNLFAFCRA